MNGGTKALKQHQPAVDGDEPSHDLNQHIRKRLHHVPCSKQRDGVEPECGKVLAASLDAAGFDTRPARAIATVALLGSFLLMTVRGWRVPNRMEREPMNVERREMSASEAKDILSPSVWLTSDRSHSRGSGINGR